VVEVISELLTVVGEHFLDNEGGGFDQTLQEVLSARGGFIEQQLYVNTSFCCGGNNLFLYARYISTHLILRFQGSAK
jgi:hypothetical protein